MFNKKKNNKGFTLVELLVVIAIIGILAVVAVPALMKNIEKGKVAKLEADYNVISTGMVTYYADKNAYPTNQVSGVENGIKLSTAKNSMSNNASEEIKQYISDLANPFNATYTLKPLESSATKSGDLGVELVISNIDISDTGVERLNTDLGAAKVKAGKKSSGKRTINIAIVGEYKSTQSPQE